MNTGWEQAATADIKIGDTLDVWWGNGRDTITDLKPYHGPLARVLGEGTKIASFALLRTGMTLEGKGSYQRARHSDDRRVK
jgi:hypothetical protein